MSVKKHRSTKTHKNSAPTIKQVAAHAGVSTATVSRALSGSDYLSDESKIRIQKSMEELNYQPNRVARNLRTRTTTTVGVILSDIRNPFFTSVVRGIEDELHKSGYTLFLCNTDEDPKKELLYLKILREEGVAGIILATCQPDLSGSRRLLGTHLPLVAIDRFPRGLDVDSVVVTNIEGAKSAVQHLLELGHERIALINGPKRNINSIERQLGYEKAFEARGIKPNKKYVQYTDFKQEGGYSAMQKLLKMKNPPTAVFAVNNLLALGALQVINEFRLSIPSDISFICFDDMLWTTAFQPPITAVSQPTYKLGTLAAEFLLKRLQNPGESINSVSLETTLILRNSCIRRINSV